MLSSQFRLCLGITNKFINSCQLIISLSCSYMFRQLRDILRELVCSFRVTCQFGFWLIEFCVSCSCVYTHVYTQPHTTHVVRNSEGTDELPEDGTQLPKHVGAAK
jgi:hypothetical protein